MRAGALAGTLGSLLLAKATGSRRLLSLYLILTERCPNTCTYCGYRDSIGNKDLASREMTLEQIRKLLQEAAAMGCRKVHLTGGEPLIRPDVGDIVDAAKATGLYVGLSTSGVGLLAKIDRLDGVDLAFVSVDGPPEIHNRNRGKADFDAAVKAVALFRAKGKKVFTTTVLNRLNLPHVDFMVDFAKRHGTVANFVFCNYHLDPAEKSHLPKREEVGEAVLTPDEMRTTIDRLIALKREGAPIGSSGAYLDYLRTWPDYEVSYRKEPHGGIDCSAGRFFAYILPDGTLYPCGDLYWRQEGRNAVVLGLEKAFDTLPAIPCHSCRTGCYVEQNLVFGMNPKAGLNWLGMKAKGYW